MWIRSQDKLTLLNVNQFDIHNNSIIANCRLHSLAFILKPSAIKIGKYSSKEKALMVLDIIQKSIGQKCFQMPQDSDVIINLQEDK